MSETPADTETPAAAIIELAPDDDEQRLIQLEKAGRLNRLLIFVLALLLLIVLASLATLAVVKMLADEPPPFDPQAFAALQQRAEDLDQQLLALKQEQARQESLIKLVATPPAAPPPSAAAAAPAALPSQDVAALRLMGRTLLGQEQGFQQGLQALKNGMRDLADMIPGSRSWLDDYNEELDKVFNASVQRTKNIQQWGSKLPSE